MTPRDARRRARVYRTMRTNLPTRRRRVALLAAALALGCGSPTAPRSDVLTVSAGARGLHLANRSAATVYFVAAEREAWALVDLAVCDDPATCSWPRVPAGGALDVPYAQVPGYRRGAEALVVHFHLVPHASEPRYEPDSTRTIVVRMR